MAVLFYRASGTLAGEGTRLYLNASNTDAAWDSPPVGAEVTVSFKAYWSGSALATAPWVQVFFGQPPGSLWESFIPSKDTPAQYSFTGVWPPGKDRVFIESVNPDTWQAFTYLTDITLSVTDDVFGEDVTLGGTGWLRGVGRSAPADGANDFGLRLACYDPLGGLRGKTRARTIERYARAGEPGTLKVAAAGEDPGIELLDAPVEVAVEVWDGAAWYEPDDARYVTRTVEDRHPAGGVRTLAVSCVGIVSLLSGALVWAAHGGELVDNKRVLAGTPGGIILTLLAEAQARGCLPGLTAGFTADTDSNGASWGAPVTVRAPLGQSLLGVLGDMGGQWWMHGRTLHGGDRGLDLTGGTDPTYLRRLAVADQADMTDWSKVADTALVVGEAGKTWAESRTETPTPWGRQEAVVTARVSTDDAAAAFMDHALAAGRAAAVQHSREWGWDPGRTRWMPDRDISIHDWIMIDTDAATGRERVRVEDLMTRQGSDGIEAFITAGTIHAELLEMLARRLPDAEAATLPPPAGVGPTPKAAGLPSINTAWHMYGGILLVSWSPVVQDVDGQPITVPSYKVEARTLPGKWATVYEGVAPAQFVWPESAPSVEVQVTARSDRGVESAPSPTALAQL